MAEELAARIRKAGPLPFPEFMAAALYDPARGYYARETRQVGRKGDFFTSVSVGPVFGELLARRFLNWWEEAGRPERWRVIEMGAHDGTLALDILSAIRAAGSEAFEGLEYRIIEPLPLLAEAQRVTLAGFGAKVVIGERADFPRILPGIAFGNELLDALPCHVLEWQHDCWRECLVTIGNDRFQWELGGTFKGFPEGPLPLPDGYRTEVRLNYRDVLKPLAEALSNGLLLWIDYGFARADYLAPERTGGTLRTFSLHQAGEDPLISPGELDITAHVDFTAVAEEAMGLGAVPREFSDQGSWLTRLAGDWLRGLEGKPDAGAIRQFQTLTHPGHLGSRFQVLELALNEEPDPEMVQRARRRLAMDGPGATSA